MPTPDKMKASSVEDDHPPNANTPMPPLATEARPIGGNLQDQGTEARLRATVREQFDARVLDRVTTKMTKLTIAAEKAYAEKYAITQDWVEQRKRVNEQHMAKIKKLLEEDHDWMADSIVSLSMDTDFENAMSMIGFTCELTFHMRDAQLSEKLGTANNANNNNVSH